MRSQEERWNRNRRIVGWTIAGALALVVAVIALGAIFGYAPYTRSGYYFPFPFFGFGWIGGIFLVFFLFFAVRWFFWPWGWGYRRSYWGYGDGSLEILRERYARGEITIEQFQRMKRDLEGEK